MCRSLLLVLFVFTVTACGDDSSQTSTQAPQEHAEGHAAWSYEGDTGPQTWGALSADYHACSDGVAQSPINVETAKALRADLPPLSMAYSQAVLQMSDTGHGFKGTPEGTNTLSIGEDTYILLQFHAHTPSEHTIDGQHYPMELHFVHQSALGDLAVVGVMVQEGAENFDYAPIVQAVASGGSEAVDVSSLNDLLPADRSYYTYPGSLTTPPCTDGVRWIVLQGGVEMAADQIAPFAAAHGSTNRPIQDLGERSLRMSE